LWKGPRIFQTLSLRFWTTRVESANKKPIVGSNHERLELRQGRKLHAIVLNITRNIFYRLSRRIGYATAILNLGTTRKTIGPECHQHLDPNVAHVESNDPDNSFVSFVSMRQPNSVFATRNSCNSSSSRYALNPSHGSIGPNRP